MTDIFQVLDLTINGWLKKLMKAKFNAWFAEQQRTQLEAGTALEDIDIKFLLTVMKPLHVGWLISCYDKLSSSEGRQVVLSGWKASGITAALEKGLEGFAPLIDPFHEIDPFNNNDVNFVITSVVAPMSEEFVDKEKYVDEESDDDLCHDVEGDGSN